MSAKGRISRVVKDVHVAARLPQRLIQITPRRSEQEIDSYAQVRRSDCLEINQLPKAGEISWPWVDANHQPLGLHLLERQTRGLRLPRQLAGPRLDSIGDCGLSWAARGVGEFQPVVFRWVVTGGDVQACRRAAPDDFVGDNGRRRVAVAEEDLHPMSRQDRRRIGRKGLREEAGIVPDDHSGLWSALGHHVFGDGAGDEANVREGEVFGNDVAPAGCAKLDRPHSAAPIVATDMHCQRVSRPLMIRKGSSRKASASLTALALPWPSVAVTRAILPPNPMTP